MSVNDARWFKAGVGVRTRPDLAVLDVEGDDRRTWLNGQISNDVRSTQPGDAVYGLVLNVRGKIVSDAWALDRGERFTLVLPAARIDDARTHMEQYIIMEDVTLRVRDDQRVISLHGPRTRDLVDGITANAFACDELGCGGHFVVCDAAEHSALLDQLSRAARALGGGVVDEALVEQARVMQRVPRYGHDFDLQHYPQEAGLKHRAVSFSKGCYLGQEVVCTLESRGKLNRRLVALGFRGGPPHVGDAILTESGDASGTITSVAADGDQGRALGYVRRIHIDANAPLQTQRGTALALEGVVGAD